MYTPISWAVVSVLLVRSIGQLPAEKPRVVDKGYHGEFPYRGSQEEHGALYYMLSEKAKQEGRPHQAFFKRLVPEYSVLIKLVLIFSANASVKTSRPISALILPALA